MNTDLNDLKAFVTVARAGGFRDAARSSGVSASGLSEALRRLEAQLGVRLLHRTTRSVTLTEAGSDLLARLVPALTEVQSALAAVNDFRDRPAGTLKLNVPASVARLVLPGIIPPFLAKYPDIALEVIVEESFVDVLAAGCDAGVRYGERLEQDMIAVPIGPRSQRIAVAASPAYLDHHGRPEHPRELIGHACLRGRFPSGAMPAWEFEGEGETLRIDPKGPLVIGLGGAADLLIDAALAGTGIVYLFEDWLKPHLANGTLEPILEPWWQDFPGPFLYYSGRNFMPTPLKAFIEFIRSTDVSEPRHPARKPL
ncbi:LysR family transcriptional regulator [Cupriavidus sp. PET2-C1]